MDAMMIDAYRFHRNWPVGAHLLGYDAQCAWAAAKAERVARDRDYVFAWTWSSEEDEAWTCAVFTQDMTFLAAISGIEEADEASHQWTRAWEAAVAVDALWGELFQRGE